MHSSIRQVKTQLSTAWQQTKSSNSPYNLWFGIILPSFFINLLMLALPLALLQAYDRIIPNNSTATLLMLVVIVIGAVILEVILRMLRAVISNWSYIRKEYLFINHLTKQILYAKVTPHETKDQQIILTYTDLINRSKQTHNEQVVINFLDGVFSILFLILIVYIGGFLVFVPLILMAIFISQIFKRKKKLKLILYTQKENDRKRTGMIVDSLSGIFTIKAFAMEPLILRRSEYLELKKAESTYEINLINMEINALVGFFSQLIFFLTVAFGSLFVIHGSLTIGGLAACTLLAGRGMQPISRLVGLWEQQQDVKSSEKFLNQIYSLEEEPFNDKGVKHLIDGQVHIDHVSYQINELSSLLLEDLSLDINAKEFIGIVDNGSKAWSLFYLIMNFLQPTIGKIAIDNIDVNEYNLENLRQQICYFPKEAALFNGTILENISGFESKKELLAREIAMNIGLEDIVSKFPEGFHTKVTSNAKQMYSAGLSQLISFVRVMVNQPKIILVNNISFNAEKPELRLIARALDLYKDKLTIFLATSEPYLISLAKRKYIFNKAKLEEFHNG